MSTNQIEFEEKYLGKNVRITGNIISSLKEFEGKVTAALYEWEENGCTILAIMAPWYTIDNPKGWITIHITPEQFDSYMSDIELIGD